MDKNFFAYSPFLYELVDRSANSLLKTKSFKYNSIMTIQNNLSSEYSVTFINFLMLSFFYTTGHPHLSQRLDTLFRKKKEQVNKANSQAVLKTKKSLSFLSPTIQRCLTLLYTNLRLFSNFGILNNFYLKSQIFFFNTSFLCSKKLPTGKVSLRGINVNYVLRPLTLKKAYFNSLLLSSVLPKH